MTSKVPIPGPELLRLVRARFIERRTSLHAWCRLNGVSHSYANGALSGRLDFPAARRLRARIIAATGLRDA